MIASIATINKWLNFVIVTGGRSIRRYILFTLSLIILVSTPTASYAGTQEFIELLNSKSTFEEKAVICYRVWLIPSGLYEILLKKGIREKDPKQRSFANSLYQIYARVSFLEQLAETKNLTSLSDEGFAAGAGMNSHEEDVHDLIKKDCIIGVNKLMEYDEFKELKEKAYNAAYVRVQEIQIQATQN